MPLRPFLLAAGALLALAFLAALLLYRTSYSPAAPTYAAETAAFIALPQRLRSPDEHDRALARGGNPYVLSLAAPDGPGALLYYGAEHVADPSHPQTADIEARWRDFAPTVALYEGRRRGYWIGPLVEPFAGLPESALVHRLARGDEVPLVSLEPAYEDEVAALLQTYPPELVALYFTLRVYAADSGGTPDDRLAADLLAKRTDVDGLRDRLPDVAAIDALWARDFADQPDWRTLRGIPGDTVLGEIDRASHILRGEHMARTLLDLVTRGERVFAVVGSGHVIRQEWALREALGAEPAWDQPGR